ncbi:hypothetical protein PI124_g7107 [Phytophthora idaei]|nr:hypothetical protein PI124_g7107 [Phytophthora idaei]
MVKIQEQNIPSLKMEALVCAFVGIKCKAFAVKYKPTKLVSDFKGELKHDKPSRIKSSNADGGVELYLAVTYDNGKPSWLDSDTKDAVMLKKGELTPAFQDMIHEDLELEGEYRIESALKHLPLPTASHIHVLIKLPPVESPSTPFRGITVELPATLEWQLVGSICFPLHFLDKALIHLPEKYVRDSGLSVVEGKDLVLYRRPELVEEWNALLQRVIDTHALLWIVGPLGAGKLLWCLAFVFVVAVRILYAESSPTKYLPY